MQRRDFLHWSALATAGILAGSQPVWAAAKAKTLLLRSSWQTVNIGDIGHTPGALALFYRYLPPSTRLLLWPSSVDNGVAEMLQKQFPQLVIVEGSIGPDGKPTTPALTEAFAQADLLVHGSGPSVVAQAHLDAWRTLTGKPYGIFGVTISREQLDEKLTDLLNHAAFVYLRDTVSEQLVKEKKIASPVVAFNPDATFAIPLRNDQQASQYLQSVGLKDKQFICVIPRLRYTPYWKIHNRTPSDDERRRDAISEQFKEVDHAKLREVITTWVRTTGLSVLACPEMTHEVALAKELLIDPLPEDVKRNAVWRDSYWLPDEATSVYQRAKALISFEMHSPLMAFGVNTPAFYLRQPTDTSKGQMWRDVGFTDWIFEIDNVTGADIAHTLLAVQQDYPKALQTLSAAQRRVRQWHESSVRVVGRTLRT